MADLFILALTVFTFQNNTKIAINIYLLEIFALFLVFSYQFTAKCLSLPPPLLGGAISKPLTLPFALAFRTSNIETVVIPQSLYYDCGYTKPNSPKKKKQAQMDSLVSNFLHLIRYVSMLQVC